MALVPAHMFLYSVSEQAPWPHCDSPPFCWSCPITSAVLAHGGFAFAAAGITGGSFMDLIFTRPNQDHEAVDHVTVVHFTGINVSLDEETITSVRDALDALVDETG